MPGPAGVAVRAGPADRAGRRDDRREAPRALGDPHGRPGPLPDEDRSALLASCYRESLRVADELGAASIAFPAVSAGVYRWPAASAAQIAVATVRETPTEVDDVRFVLFNDEVYAAFERALG
nr:hypothetical protein GCM10025732_40600 [Glycomyces mayteni]